MTSMQDGRKKRKGIESGEAKRENWEGISQSWRTSDELEISRKKHQSRFTNRYMRGKARNFHSEKPLRGWEHRGTNWRNSHDHDTL